MFDLRVGVVKEFLEDIISKDVVLEKEEVWVDFLCKEGRWGMFAR